MKTITLTQGKVALVDDSDYDFLSRWKWRALKARRTNTGAVWYAHRTTARPNRKAIYMHREVLRLSGFSEFEECDHKDSDGLNNQRDNLRPVTVGQNRWGMRKKNRCSSRFKGVYWHKKTSKWMARICFEGHHYYLGVFENETDAGKAYDAAAISRFGEFARLNFKR